MQFAISVVYGNLGNHFSLDWNVPFLEVLCLYLHSCVTESYVGTYRRFCIQKIHYSNLGD